MKNIDITIKTESHNENNIVIAAALFRSSTPTLPVFAMHQLTKPNAQNTARIV